VKQTIDWIKAIPLFLLIGLTCVGICILDNIVRDEDECQE
jgi:hypothetical protein